MNDLDYYSEAMTGSWSWAQYQLDRGKQVRRHDWPIRPKPGDGFDVWRIYRSPDDHSRIGKGWYAGHFGWDGTGVEELGTSGGGYIPSPDDARARDWQLLDDVSDDQFGDQTIWARWRYYDVNCDDYLQQPGRSNATWSLRQRMMVAAVLIPAMVVVGISFMISHFIR